MTKIPEIIQGGMGVGVSDFRLSREVSKERGLGVVSGTGLEASLVRRLQLGDQTEEVRTAMQEFPNQEIVEKAINNYFIEGGKDKKEPFKLLPMHQVESPKKLLELTVLANFVEVFLAKEGHSNPVGINYLEKIQLPHLASIYGAMLAGVEVIEMGAGIQTQVPGILDSLSQGKPVTYKLNVEGATKIWNTYFDPKWILEKPNELHRPEFLGVISSNILARALITKSSGKVNGFVIEGPSAGGHNATPRRYQENERGEPIYGPKDEVNLNQISKLGLPFWLAGSYGTPEKLQEAKKLGAEGIQAGSIFALAKESGITRKLKQKILSQICNGEIDIFSDPKASPTGFPFKIIVDEAKAPPRICDLGYLRTLYEKEEGIIGYRCPSENIESYLKKGGRIEDTVGKRCLCNALCSNVGLGQIDSKGNSEKPLITLGKDISGIKHLAETKGEYSVEDVMKYLRKKD